MHPIKPKQLIQQTAEQTGFSLPTVSAVVGFFYTELNKSMGTCKDINIQAPGLGTFVMNRKRTEKKLVKLEKLKVYAEDKVSEKPDSNVRNVILQDRLVRISELSKALELFDNQEKKRLQVKQSRNLNNG